ncbi:LppA-related lipoprotein [Mycoplasma sp. 6243]|uniref:LppA-related lipoprotein n=1 Tax=Mycoplasma sp. 6243 TaxID=3440865 RepID=UPI003EBEED47
MKKNKRIFWLLSSLATAPILAVACANKTQEKPRKEIKETPIEIKKPVDTPPNQQHSNPSKIQGNPETHEPKNDESSTPKPKNPVSDSQQQQQQPIDKPENDETSKDVKTPDNSENKTNTDSSKQSEQEIREIQKHPDTSKTNPQQSIMKNDFSDVINLQKNITITNANKFYKEHDSAAAWLRLKAEKSNLLSILNINNELQNKYNVAFTDTNNDFYTNQNNGTINNIALTFTTKNPNIEEKTLRFNINGFKVNNSTSKTNQKESFLSKKTLTDKVTRLFPSLLAYMLMYTEDPNKYNELQMQAKEGETIINFEQLFNKNTSLFTNGVASLNDSLKTQFLEKNKSLENLYEYKITGVKFNDEAGTLGIQVLIENQHDNHSNEAIINQEFEFNGLRKLQKDVNMQNDIVSYFITAADLTSIITQNNKLKQTIDKHKNPSADIDITSEIGDMQLALITKKIFDKLLVDVADPLDAYKVTYASLNTKNYIGLHQGFVLYPYISRLNQNINSPTSDKTIQNMKVIIKKSTTNGYNVTFNFDVITPIGVRNSYSDLSDNGYDEEKNIVHHVIGSVRLDALEKR